MGRGHKHIGMHLRKLIIRLLLGRVVSRLLSAEFVKFNIVGGVGVLVNVAAFYLFYNLLAIHHMISGALATEVAIINNFILNDAWTFRGRSVRMKAWARLILFHASRLLGMAVTLATLYILSDVLGLNVLLSYFIGIALGVLTNFYTSDVYVWSKR
jgi:dolichol-phosphate mannosyltransferase